MQPALMPAVDNLPYNNEPIIVVGCGTTHVVNVGGNQLPGHRIPLGNPNTHADIFIPAHLSYTIDVNHAQGPHRVGDFWVADHTEDLPGGRFSVIFFENLPGPLFANRGWCLTAVRAAHRLLQAGGRVVIRAGLGTINPGGHLDQALQDVFGPHQVTHNADGYGVIQDIRAVK